MVVAVLVAFLDTRYAGTMVMWTYHLVWPYHGTLVPRTYVLNVMSQLSDRTRVRTYHGTTSTMVLDVPMVIIYNWYGRLPGTDGTCTMVRTRVRTMVLATRVWTIPFVWWHTMVEDRRLEYYQW